jgi:hypothetical protein
MTLQFRRGTDSDRLTITPSAGEPIWTTDTEKLYVGDGSTAGGILATGGTGGTDSATVSTIITATVDSAYINARTDANLDSAATLNLINAAYIQSNQITYNTSDFADSAFVTSQINAISIPTLGNDFVDSSAARGLLSGGTGVTYNSGTGEISIGQAVGITDSAVFASLQTAGNVIVGGNLQVTGTTTTVNSEDLNVTDNMIYMNAGESSGSPTASIDVGWAANVNDDGSYTHVGMFRDATDNTFKVFGNYTPEPNAAVEINTGHASFTLAPFAASTLSGEYLGFDSDVTAAGLATQTYVTTRPISTFTNDANYLDSTTVQGVINSSYIQSNQTTYNTSDFADSAFVTSQIAAISIPTLGNDFVDSAQVQLIVDSAYVQLRQSAGGGTVDSADIIAIVDSAYIQARQTTVAAGATTITQYDYEADSGQTTFTGADIDGQSLSYTAGKLAVYLNGILLVDSNDYTATNGSSIVLTSGVDSGDTLSIIAYVTEAVGTLDSAATLNLINASYIQSNQTTYNTSDFADSAFVTSQIAAISIPTLGNDFVDSGQVIALVDSAYVQARQSSSSSSTFDLEASNRANYGWHADLSSATNTGTYIFGFNGAATFNGIFWSTDGSYLFEVDGLDDFVRRITVPTPFDISSVTTPYDTSNQIDTTSENAYTEDLWFSPDGLRLVLLGSSGSTDHAVHSYTLTSPWDLTTATYDSKTINVNSTGGGGVAGIHLSPDGRKMFIASNSTDKVHEYTLSTAYDVSTATETRTLDISSQTGGASGIRFNHQGTQMFISDSSNGVIVYQYKLTLPFNVSSASYVTSHTGSSGSGAGKGLAFSPDGAYLHTLGNGRVYEITLTGNVSYATPVVSKDVLAYDSNLQDFVDAFTLPTSDGSANQVLVTNGSGTISFAEQSGGLDSALITQLIDSAYVQLRQTASGGGGGGTDSASVNTLIDAKLQVLDVSDIVGADGNYGEYLKSLGNGEAEWTDLATQAKQKAFAMALIFG